MVVHRYRLLQSELLSDKLFHGFGVLFLVGGFEELTVDGEDLTLETGESLTDDWCCCCDGHVLSMLRAVVVSVLVAFSCRKNLFKLLEDLFSRLSAKRKIVRKDATKSTNNTQDSAHPSHCCQSGGSWILCTIVCTNA